MSQKYNLLRNGSKSVDEEVTVINVENEVEDEVEESFTKDVSVDNYVNDDPPTPELNIMNLDLIERVVDKVGVRIREDVGAIIESLKIDLLAELNKRDARMAELENEVIFLRDSMASSMATSGSKINALEAKVVELSESIEAIKATSPDPASHANALPTIDNVIAGDSIVKHVDVSILEGNCQLICLPGARARQVDNAVRKLAKTANIKNLVLHYGTNSITHMSPLGVCKEIEASIRRTQFELPNTSLHFSALLPKIDSSFNRGINFINNYICDLTNELEMGFVQHASFSLQGHLSKRMYSPTEWREEMPIHPSHEGALLMSTNYKLHLLK
jgi:hypothetical protein